MPLDIAQIRKKYPQYNALPDQELADRLHAKYYAGMPKEEFYSKIGLGSGEPQGPLWAETQDGLLKDGSLLGQILDMQAGGTEIPRVRPSFGERLTAHFKAGRTNDVLTAAGMSPVQPNTGAAERYAVDVYGNSGLDEATTSLRRFENVQTAKRAEADLAAMPDSETPADYAAATIGELGAAALSPENAILPGVGKVYRGLRTFAGPVLSRILSRGVQVAAPNLGVDPLVQSLRGAAGLQDEYDPWRTALGTVLGFGIGAGGSTMAQVVSALRGKTAARRGIPQDKVLPGDVDLEDLYSPEVLRIMEANNALTPQQLQQFGRDVENRLAAREAAAQARREAIVAQTVGTPPEVRVDLPGGADVQAALQPAPAVIPMGQAPIGAGDTAQVRGNVAGEQLRGTFNAPAVVTPAAEPMSDQAVAIARAQMERGGAGVEGDKLVAPAAGAPRTTSFGAPLQVVPGMTDEQIAQAQARMRGGQTAPGVEAVEAPDKLMGSEDRLPQTRDQMVGQDQAAGAFDLTRRQRERVAEDTDRLGQTSRDSQAAGRPEGVNAQDVVLDDGFPVQILETRFVPDARGRVTPVVKVQRFNPRTGQLDPEAVPYETALGRLQMSRYAQEPRMAQDFQGRAAGPLPPEAGRMPEDQNVYRAPRQTYRETARDPNQDFPGASSARRGPPGGDGAGPGPGEAMGRSPFPEQPSGPHPGRQRPRNEEEAIRDFEARQKAGEQADATAGARYKEGQFSTKAKGQGSDKAWHVDESGFVLSDKGGPVRFGDQKQAAKWILNVGHKDSPQTFEIANHPSGKGFTVRERGRAKPDEGGSAGAKAAPGSTAEAAPEGTRAGTPPRALPPPKSAAAQGDTRAAAAAAEPAAARPAGEPGQTPPAGQPKPPRAKAKAAAGEPDFENTFPKPDPKQLEALDNEGREHPFSEQGDFDAQNKAVHEEVIHDIRGDVWAWHRLTEALAEGVDPRTGKAPKDPEKAKKLAADTKAAIESHVRGIEETLAAYEDVWGTDNAMKLRNYALSPQMKEQGIGDLIPPAAEAPRPQAKAPPAAETAPPKSTAAKPSATKAKAAPKAKAPAAGDVPRTQEQLLGRLNRADKRRAEGAPLTKEQKGQAEAAKQETANRFEEAKAEAGGLQRELKAWEAKLDEAMPPDPGTPNYSNADAVAAAQDAKDLRRGWEAALAGAEKPWKPAYTGNEDLAAKGFKDAQAWLAENPKPADTVSMKMETARGQETNLKLKADSEAIADLAERVSKLPLGRFYSNPFDPQLIKDLYGPLFGREAQRWADELGETWRELKGFDGQSVLKGAGDIARVLFLSNDGILRSLAKRFADADGAPNRAIEHVADMFFAPVGDAGKVGIGRTYGEAVERRVQAAINRLTDLLKPFEDYSLEQQRQVLEQISRLIVNGKVTNTGSTVHKIAAEIQKDLKDWLAYAREAGVEIGDQGPNYFPRELAVDRILANPKRFLAKAAEAYRADGADGAEAEAMAQAWMRRIQESDLGFRSDGNDFVQVGTGQTPKNERARELSSKADRILDDFYLRNVADVLPQYYLRMARRTEWVRRMGGDLEKWKAMREAIAESGAGEAIPDIVRTIQSMTGTAAAPVGSARRMLLSAAKVAGAVTYLPRAVLSSLTEPVITATRSGNALDIARSYMTTTADIVRQVTGLGSAESRTAMAREIAEDLGLVSQIGDDMLMAQRFGGRVENKLARRITNQFFVRTGLHHFTEATRVAATNIGQIFIRRLARSLDAGDAFGASSKFLMGELGIKDPEAFARYVNKFENGIPTPDELRLDKSADAEAYKDALYRFVSQSILKPGGEVKARYANHPIGSLFYHLQSYNYAFQKNVLNRYGKLGVAAFRGKGMNVADRMRLMAPLAWYASVAVPMQYYIGKLRDVYQDDPGVDPAFKKRTVPEEIFRAISRAGLGMADFPANIFTGIKYSRDPATMATGPLIGGLLEGLKSGIELYGKDNSPNTNTSERRASKYLYETVMKPIMVSALSLAPGKIGAALSIPGIQYVSLPKARDAVVTAMQGPPGFKTHGSRGRGRNNDRAGRRR